MTLGRCPLSIACSPGTPPTLSLSPERTTHPHDGKTFKSNILHMRSALVACIEPGTFVRRMGRTFDILQFYSRERVASNSTRKVRSDRALLAKSEPRNPETETRRPKFGTRNPKPGIRNPETEIRNQKPETRNTKTQNRKLKPESRNSKPVARNLQTETQTPKPGLFSASKLTYLYRKPSMST